MPVSITDVAYIERAIQLAQKAANPSPNPRVGAVIVKDGNIIAEGWHQRAGEAHAEIIALQKAGKRAAGATLFVTLEPCNHTGRTPPCANAIMRAGIKKVIIGMPDPSKRAGGGAHKLQKAGLQIGFAGKRIEQACRDLNPAWLKSLTSPLPFITLKLALTADDETVTPPKKKWITHAASRQLVQKQRAMHDAILVGIGTVLADDPRLTVRTAAEQPVRVILDPHGKMLATAKMLREPGETIIITKKPKRITGAKNISVPSFRLPSILKQLKKRGLTSVYVEGGAITAQKFLKENLIDKIYLFQAHAPRSTPQLFGARFPAQKTQKKVIKTDTLWDITLHAY